VVLGVTRCRLAVRAKSIGRALKIVGRQRPGGEAKVVFVMDPESSFIPNAATKAGAVDPRLREPTVVWPELFGQFWDQVACL
jgi:hypothetical protein